MKTIHKLVLKSYLGPMILTFLIVMFVLLLNFLWRYIDELVGKGLDTSIIIELIGYAMINMIPMGLPLAMLLAAIMTMGNLGENYELLAMKSAGMSLPRIIQPMIYVVVLISIGSFFISNDLVPYANKKMFSTIYDIRQQKQVIEFHDGLFFNGIDNMSIRVERQDPDSKQLYDVLIYDNREANGNMTTTVADSGYIRLSPDKNFLLITLYNGETYEQTRSSKWYAESTLRRNNFTRQDLTLEMTGFSMENRTDADAFSNSQTKNIKELERDIDSLDRMVNSSALSSYGPLLRERIFIHEPSVLTPEDSTYVDKSAMMALNIDDSLSLLSMRDKNNVWEQAKNKAQSTRYLFSFDEAGVKNGLNQLYRSEVEWHRKWSLPVSILIFFLIGAPLGAIIRKGGLGLPVVISVIFFVIYYIISLTGEKMVKEGTWIAIWGSWISSYVLTPVAIYLTVKATHDSGLFDLDWYRIKFDKLKKQYKARREVRRAAKLENK